MIKNSFITLLFVTIFAIKAEDRQMNPIYAQNPFLNLVYINDADPATYAIRLKPTFNDDKSKVSNAPKEKDARGFYELNPGEQIKLTLHSKTWKIDAEMKSLSEVKSGTAQVQKIYLPMPLQVQADIEFEGLFGGQTITIKVKPKKLMKQIPR